VIIEYDDDGWCPRRNKPCEKIKRSLNGVCVMEHQGCRYVICPLYLGTALPMLVPLRYDPDDCSDVVFVNEQIIHTPPSPRVDFVMAHPGTREMAGVELQSINITGNIRKLYNELSGRKHKDKDHDKLVDSYNRGVNQTNMLKYLGTQILQKGSFFRYIGIPYIVLIQEPNLQYILRQVPVTQVSPEDANLIFYSVDLDENGDLQPVRQYEVDVGHLPHVENPSFVMALLQKHTSFDLSPEDARREFEERVFRRAEKKGLLHPYHVKRMALLEAEMEELCECGHTRREHWGGPCVSGELIGVDGAIPELDPCPCTEFVRAVPSQVCILA